MGDIATAFAVVFLAELGDKTQLVALTLAGRYPAVKALAVLGAAIVLLQTLSVTAGALISRAVPDRAIAMDAPALPRLCGGAVALGQRGRRRRRGQRHTGNDIPDSPALGRPKG